MLLSLFKGYIAILESVALPTEALVPSSGASVCIYLSHVLAFSCVPNCVSLWKAQCGV
jgi:hypothetical protein